MSSTALDLGRRAVLAGAAAATVFGWGGQAGAARAAPVRLRVATDVNGQHLLTVALKRYIEAANAAFPGRLHVELFHSGQLYYDRDMARALHRGDLDLAAPTITTLSRIAPDCGVTSLPIFYGREAAATHRISDGPVGAEIARRIGQRLDVRPVWTPVDLGYINLFSTRRADQRPLRGSKVRVPSGAANVMRLRALGAYPVMLPFADVPMALSQGAVDAVETTAETIRTGQLWDAGLAAGLTHRAVFLQYVPLFSGHFWRRLDPPLRTGLTDLWRGMAEEGRTISAARQRDAQLVCERNGIVFREPNPAQAAQDRATLARAQDGIVQRLGIDPVLVRQAVETVG
jgi:C4-dicarboxylate-binding protein DctP